MLTNPVPGTAAQVLSAVLRSGTSATGGRATFSLANFPDLPSLGTEVVWLPQYAVIDANGEFTGMLISQGWATRGVTAVTAAYTPQPADAVILCNATGGAFTVTLPDATQPGYSAGQRYTIVKTDSSANAVTVNASAGQLISGGSSLSLTTASAFTSVVFDGVNTSNWWVWAASATSSGSPTGAAGGFLSGTYPNPGPGTATANLSMGAHSITNVGASPSTVTLPYFSGVFGDGSDGTVLLNGTNTFGFATLASNTYTLTRDVFATSLTISNGVTLQPNGCRVFCLGAFSNAGTVTVAGPVGTSGGTGGAQGNSTTVGNGSGGAAGGTTTGSSSANKNAAIATGVGGNGGNGTGGNTGGGAGSIGNSSSSQLRTPSGGLSGAVYVSGSTGPIGGGTGGGGGGGDGTNKGGGGGSAGGVVLIFAESASNTGTITAAGGNGGTPATGNCGGGGGGGGGLILVYTLAAWTAGTTSVAGGTQGSGVGTGTAGTAGAAGTVLNVVLT